MILAAKNAESAKGIERDVLLDVLCGQLPVRAC